MNRSPNNTVNMSLAPSFPIKTTAILFALFSLTFAGATVDDEYPGGGVGSVGSNFLNLRPSRLQEDNTASGNKEHREVIRKAEELFVGGGYISEQLPEVPHAQTSSQAVGVGDRLDSGSSFSFKQDLSDDGPISASSFSLNKGSLAANFNGYAPIMVEAAAYGSNPLIESDVSNTEKTHTSAGKLKRYRRAGRHRPLGGGGLADGHKHWCHRDCTSSKLSHVCASDGRLYGSWCELMRHSCLHNVHLFKKPTSHCAPQMNRNESLESSPEDDDTNDDGDGDDDDDEAERKMAGRSNSESPAKDDGEEVNIVELKGRCNRAELEAMKSLLLRQFGGDIGTLFEYLDSNNDHYIEAHELWPRRDAASANKSLYAQAWDDHSSNCQVGHSGPRYHIDGDRSKCWFFLDFAFEPRYPSNPCSLSHLILFDLRHPTSKFSLNTFQKAFQNVLALNNESIDPKSKLHDQFKLFTSKTRLYIGLGKTVSLNCLPNSTNQMTLGENLIDENGDDILNFNGAKCLWTRYNLNMAAKIDPHISVKRQNAIVKNKKIFHDLTLHIKDAQLYLSGQFKCSCSFAKIERNFEHIYDVQVLAEPRVSVRPKFQWSLPHSRVSFECQYDHIDTSFRNNTSATPKDSYKLNPSELDEANGQFGIQIKWLKENQNLVAESGEFTTPNNDASYLSSKMSEEGRSAGWLSSSQDDQFDSPQDEPINSTRSELLSSSLRASVTMAASRLTLEDLQLNDTGRHTCQVEVPISSESNSSSEANSVWLLPDKSDEQAHSLVGLANGSLLVQEQPITDQSDGGAQPGAYLWMFHDNGISVYKLQNDDGQEMELVKEINGHSMASGEVDGNWNQLTLCGGLNPEQVVICEWSDNAVRVEVNQVSNADVAGDKSMETSQRKYIYVGQPNLNRIVVLDGLRFEIVAIVNTEPQPRKLHLYKPNKVHLSKWVRRRLSPVANARWLAAVGTLAHSLKSTPVDSRLYSNEPWKSPKVKQPNGHRHRQRDRRGAYSSSANQLPSALIQHDIWLLCYGQPLVVDPSSDESEEDAIANSFYSTFDSSLDNNTTPSGLKQHKLMAASNSIQPFTPRLSPPFVWSIWSGTNSNNNKESKLRNRKSVHIIQSTFFPQAPTRRGGFHTHDEDNQAADAVDEEGFAPGHGSRRNYSTAAATTFVGEFKRSTVLTTHHIFSSLAGLSTGKTGRRYFQRAGTGHQLDLLQDLFVPSKPYSLELNDHHKIHYAYVTHYAERRLFRVNMDEYRYDQEIDLENCDPINLMTTAQGLLIVQCRALITHELIGQLVLDQLTSSRVEFNGNVRAQESYLSPDNRYLISIHNNSTLASSGPLDGHDKSSSGRRRGSHSSTEQEDHLRRQASIVYVQLVTVSGLKLQYEIKTSLEMSQCSFVWKDGYYAAILVSTNRRDQQSEILSLRLADSRLELMARVPGVISRTRHKEQLVVSPELRLAALSTNQGTYVVDLEDNRVSQSLRYHQSPPTLLWV